MVNYIVFDSGSSASQLMFNDIKDMEDVIETSNIFQISNPILKVLNKIHMSGKVNKIINLPFKYIWDSYYLLSQLNYEDNCNYIIVFTNISIRKIRLEYLQNLKKRKNIFLVLVAVDSFVDKDLCPLDVMKNLQFDLIYSFDKSDCEKYNLEYTDSLYSKRNDIIPIKETSDIYFIGRAKDRYNTILQITKKLNENKLKCNFNLLGVDKRKQQHITGINYIDKVKPYDNVLSEILSSNCLLDIVQNGQSGLTMRVYESIFYNKRLITNNKSVKKLKYYNSEYIHVIDDIEDIDIEFLQNMEKVDFKYKGEYSPINFLKNVKTRLEEMGKL